MAGRLTLKLSKVTHKELHEDVEQFLHSEWFEDITDGLSIGNPDAFREWIMSEPESRNWQYPKLAQTDEPVLRLMLGIMAQARADYNLVRGG